MECFNEHILHAKYFLLNIPSKKEFDKIINDINLTDIEYKIIILRFKLFKNISDISSELNISEQTVFKVQRRALEKIYRFLNIYNYI